MVRSEPMTPSISSKTPEWRMSTGFGRPVVPEVKLMAAMSSSRRSPSTGPPASVVQPPSSATITGSAKRSARSGVVTAATGPTSATTWVTSPGVERGFTGT